MCDWPGTPKGSQVDRTFILSKIPYLHVMQRPVVIKIILPYEWDSLECGILPYKMKSHIYLIKNTLSTCDATPCCDYFHPNLSENART